MNLLHFALALAVTCPAPSSQAANSGPDAIDGAAAAPTAEIGFSNLVVPLYLSEEQPEARSVQHIQLFHSGLDRGRGSTSRSLEQTLDLARQLRDSILAGADFEEVAARFSDGPTASRGAMLGTFPPGQLLAPMEQFLAAAEVGAVSEPIAVPSGVHILRRVERWAGGMQILIKKVTESEDPAEVESARAKALERMTHVQALLESGAEFSELASEYSDDPFSAPQGGQMLVAERGRNNVLLKEALFAAKVGEVFGPIESPLGFHLVKRVPVDEIDRQPRENNWVRARAILVAYDGAPGAPPTVMRSADEAMVLALEVHDRLVNGEDMATVAAELNDDTFGKERRGDLGWLYRRSGKMARVLDRLFSAEVGRLFEPTFTTAGWVILRREK